MSFAYNSCQQLSISDAGFYLTEREKNMLHHSWAEVFSKDIFPRIDERPFEKLYSRIDSRPNTPVNVIVGALILKELLNLSDDETLSSLLFDIRFQYALHTTSFEEQPMSDRTLGRFRERCHHYEEETGIDLLGDTLKGLSKELAALCTQDTHLKRMDSLMIAANIRKLSRLELLYAVTRKTVKGLSVVPDSLKHYLSADGHNQFLYHTRSEGQDTKLEIVLHDAETLLPIASADSMLCRVMNEQTIIENGTRRLRNKGEGMTSSNLQSPSDEEATFRFKSGENHIGYMANVIEHHGIVEDYAYETNNYSDNRFLEDVLEKEPVHEEDTIPVSDGGYSGYGYAHEKKAKEKHVTLIHTNLTGKATETIHADFQFDEDEVTACPNHIQPQMSVMDERSESWTLHMGEACLDCPYRDRCQPKKTSKGYVKTVSRRMQYRAKQSRYRSTEEFRFYTRFRNGVEAIPSLLRRKYHVDKIPAHGKIRTKIFFGFKIMALNVKRFCAMIQAQDKCAFVKENG